LRNFLLTRELRLKLPMENWRYPREKSQRVRLKKLP
jgi:hypothetical protein